MNKFTKYITTTLCVLFLASCGASTSSSVSSSSESSSSSPSSSHSSSSQSSSSSSSSQVEPKGRNKVVSNSLYVEKVENLRDDFIIGMDCSSVLSLEESGVKYYDFDNNEQDLFKILSDVGVNHIRIRIWNDPFDKNHKGYGGGNVDINRAIEIAKRVNNYGMKVIADFHYSDFWTDPGNYNAPKAWEGKSIEEKQALLYDYTYDCMIKFKDNNIDLDIVQVGNETNHGMAGERLSIQQLASFINQGSKAVKEVYPNAKVAVHFTDPGKGMYYAYASELKKYNCNYDIFGTSYYPFLHGDLDNLRTQMDNIARSFNQQVMVLETSYAFSDVDYDDGGKQFPNGEYEEYYPITLNGQANSFRDICDVMSNKIFLNRGIGVCYWEGAWISVPGKNYNERKIKWNEYGSGWASKYAAEYSEDVKKYGEGGSQVDNQCFFDSNGKPLESLKVFGMMYEGNVVEERIDDVKDIHITYNILDDFDLPSKIPAIFNNNHVKDVDVSWEAYDIEEYKKQGAGEYIIKGKVDKFDVKCILTLNPHNLLTNGSFEDGINPWVINSKNKTKNDYWVNVASENVYDGEYSLGWWGLEEGIVNFDLVQKFTVDEDGNYNLFLYSIGGADYSPVPLESQNNYVSITDEDDEEIDCVDIIIKDYDAGFEQTKIEDMYLEKNKEYTITIHIESSLSGYWGAVDFVNLYR